MLQPSPNNNLSRLKNRFMKYWPNVSYFLIDLESIYLNRDLKTLVIGSGRNPKITGNNVTNLDIEPFEYVSVVSDAQSLPFSVDSFDAIVCHQVLEHVPNADEAVSEMYRVLKPGGILIVSVPFYFPFHASPYDFRRWTLPGIKQTFKKFDEVDSGMYIGPVSSLLTGVLHGLSILIPGFYLSYFIRGIFGYILMPLKYLDAIFSRLPNAVYMAASVYFVGNKPVL